MGTGGAPQTLGGARPSCRCEPGRSVLRGRRGRLGPGGEQLGRVSPGNYFKGRLISVCSDAIRRADSGDSRGLFFFLLALHSPQPSERKTSSPGSPEECGRARELLGEMGWVLLPSL